MITYIRTLNADKPAEYLSSVIGRHLKNDTKVFWLVPGGSAIAVAVKTAVLLQAAVNLGNLTVTLTDERYGRPSHEQSNWQQLGEAGFSLSGANLQPVLNGKTMIATTEEFSEILKESLEAPGYKIGLFGMGGDGHTSGILPGSPAVKSSDFAVSYDGGEFQRITTTPNAIAKLDEAMLYALGKDKWPMIKKLQTDTAVDEQPVQILKNVPKLTVFSDYKGGIL